MDPKRLDYLLEQHRLKRLSLLEEAELNEWYEALDDPSVEPVYAEDTPEAKAYVARHTKQIMARIASQRRGRTQRMWMKVASVLLTGLVIAYLVWPEGQNAADKGTAIATEAIGSTRYVTLPDSSTVILSKGSSLKLVPGFGNTNRHLMLKGEAYFDVKHNASLPFIIQTGKVKTTVLGTAFNIKQVGDSVSVTVARGKVQVERDNKMLAVLTPGQQIATSDRTAATQVTTAKLEPVTAWMHEGLHFNNTRLADAVAQLQQRYGIEIILKTPGMENCIISIATPLSGTESLNNVMDVIRTILGANYIINNDKIEITGEPCNRE